MKSFAAKYRPNLSNLMNLCDTNYMMLLKLLADKDQVNEKNRFLISDFLAYTITTKEVTRYTSLIHMAQDVPLYSQEEELQPSSTITNTYIKKKKITAKVVPKVATKVAAKVMALFHPSMVIRLYHDARVAEVISSQDIQQVQPRYDYPNVQMHHPDEKEQMNLFLKEWLQLCLRLGYVDVALNNLRDKNGE